MSLVNSYKCKHCEYSNTNALNFKKHTLVHSERKMYDCDKCNFTSNHKFSLKRHMYTHTHRGKTNQLHGMQCNFH